MMHYSADLYGHEYVNRWALGWFPDIKEALSDGEKMLKIVRHVLVETYMDNKVPKDQSTDLNFPKGFVSRCFLSSEALGRYPSNTAMKYAEEMREYAFNKSQDNTVNMVDIFNYFKSWQQDLDNGIDAWLDTWHKITIDMTANGRSIQDAKNELSYWVSNYFGYMTPAPDKFVDFVKVLDSLNIFKPVKELIIEEAKKFLNDFVKAATGIDVADSIAEIKKMFEQPELYLNNGILYADKNITEQLDKEFGNFGQSSDTLNQSFYAFSQCINMGKLCLIGPENLNSIIGNAKGQKLDVFKPLLCTGSIDALNITIKTKKNDWPWDGYGTDDNIYFGIALKNGEYFELLLDKPGYNDFESDACDTYYFKLPKHVNYSEVAEFRLRNDHIAIKDDWTPEWMRVCDQFGRELWGGGLNQTFTGKAQLALRVDTAQLSQNNQLQMDHKIISFLYSLDGVGKTDNNNPTQYKQWTDENNIFFTDPVLREQVYKKLFGDGNHYTYVPRAFHLGFSKGVDTFVNNEKSGLTVVLSAAGNDDCTYTGQEIGATNTNHYEIYSKLTELSGRFSMRCTNGQNDLAYKYAEINPYTGNLRDTNLGNMLDTHPIIADDYIISYGFSDTGMNKSDQAYMYVTKNQSDWMGELLSAHKILTKQPFKVFAIPGSHDAGMFTGINSDAEANALIKGLIDKYVTTEQLEKVLKVAIPGEIAAPFVKALAQLVFMADASTSMIRRAMINLAYTQKDDITTQLVLGSRWFDFRPGYNAVNNDGILRHQHMFIPGYEFENFLNDVVSFLDTHKNEIVVVSINYNGFMEDYMIPKADIVNGLISKALEKSTSKIKIIGPEGLDTPIESLISDNKRLVIIAQDKFKTENDQLGNYFRNSYSDDAYATDNPESIIGALENTINTPKEAKIKGTNLQLQGTYTNKIFSSTTDILSTFLSLSDATSPLLYTKAKFDCATYKWILQNINNPKLNVDNSGLIIFLNDFVDSLIVNRAAALIRNRCSLKITYEVHVENIGWMPLCSTNEIAGTTGQSLRMEAIKINTSFSDSSTKLGIRYRAHVQNIGWQDWVYNGEIAGTTGQAKRLEAIQIELTDTDASNYNVSYRVHVQDIGWQDWVCNGAIAGTTGQSKRMEAIQISIDCKR